jgi:hypothetical protein
MSTSSITTQPLVVPTISSGSTVGSIKKTSDYDGCIYTAGQLLSANIPPNQLIVPGMFVEGKSAIIAGGYGEGKSTLGIQIGVGMASGEGFFGRTVNRAYRVGYFDLELGSADFQKRLNLAVGEYKNLELVNENFIYFDGSPEGKLSGKLKFDDAGTKLIATLIQQHGIEALIVDNLSLAFVGKIEESSPCMAFKTNLDKIRSACPKLKLPIFLHHTNKPSPDAPKILKDVRMWLATVRGSGKLLDHITCRFGFARETSEDGDEYFVLNGISSNSSVTPILLQKDEETLQFSVHGDQQLKISNVFAKAELRVWERMGKTFKTSDFGANKSAGMRMLRKAKENELVAEITRGTYRKGDTSDTYQ